MTSMRDLAEAQAYERRRLVRAFVTADPAPARGDGPSLGAALLGGVALTIALLLGVAAAVLRSLS